MSGRNTRRTPYYLSQ